LSHSQTPRPSSPRPRSLCCQTRSLQSPACRPCRAAFSAKKPIPSITGIRMSQSTTSGRSPPFFQPFAAVGCRFNAIGGLFEDVGHHLPNAIVVFDQQNQRLGAFRITSWRKDPRVERERNSGQCSTWFGRKRCWIPSLKFSCGHGVEVGRTILDQIRTSPLLYLQQLGS
jgi:hypothetical protein